MSSRRARRIRAGIIVYRQDVEDAAFGRQASDLRGLARRAYWESAVRSHRHDRAIVLAVLRRALSGGNG